MARQLLRVAAAATVFASSVAFSEETVPEAPKVPLPPSPPVLPSSPHHTPGSGPMGREPFGRPRGMDPGEIAKFFETLPPEQREEIKKRFQEFQKHRAEQRGGIKKADPEESKFLEKLSPEQREKFKENIKRWQTMPDDEREAIRMREAFRHRMVEQEVEKFLKESGLQLDKEHREAFTLRYAQERRKIEENLQKEVAEKRAPLLKELTERLKNEFGPDAGAKPPETK